MLKVFISAALTVHSVLGTPIRARTGYSVKETHAIPRQWVESGPAPGNHMLRLQIGLKQSNFDELERHLYEGRQPPCHAFCTRQAKCSQCLTRPTTVMVNI